MRPEPRALLVACLSSALVSYGTALARAPAPAPAPTPTKIDSVATISIPNGSAGIGFDDLCFSSALGKVLVPGGRTGNLVLVDPGGGPVGVISGFSTRAEFGGGHGDGITSVDAGLGRLFVVDRSSLELDIVDTGRETVVARTTLASSPDYVRCIEPTREVWVTEPDEDRIEVFRLDGDVPSGAAHAAFVAVRGGPESLVIDPRRGRAYTHLWAGKTVAIDLQSRSVVATWPNGCSGSRGLALDADRGLLFVGCSEGRAVVLDVSTGKVRSSLAAGNGVDIIAYDPKLGHLYVPGGKSATLSILAVSAQGALSLLGTFPTAPGSHCVTVDGEGTAYVCDPKRGRLLVIRDPYPAAPR